MALEYGYFDSEITGYDEEGMPEFDRAKTSDFMADFFSKLISSGVLAEPANCFQVTASDEMTVAVAPGYAYIKGRFAYDEETEYLTLEPAPTTSSYKRIDLVVLRNNYAERLCELLIKTGTPAADPVEPELIQGDHEDYYEICLAKISVSSNQSVITQADITDTRFDSAYCGAVTQLIDHVDTSVLFAQFYEFYEQFTAQADDTYSNWKEAMQTYVEQLQESGDTQLEEILTKMTDFESKSEISFNEWFATIQDILDTNIAAKLEGDVEELQARCDTLEARTEDMMEMLVTGKVKAGIMTMDGEGLMTENGEGLMVDWKICRCTCSCQ